MTELRCEACDGPIDAVGSACPACGWVARKRAAEPEADVESWADDEALALKVEAATAGEYAVEGLIGHGGMATVYLAREIALERPVAIKVMSPHVMRSRGMAERFKREARMAAALSHPNIIPIYAVRESGSLVCLVMKRVTGRALDAILSEHHALPLPVAQLLLRDIAAGLEFAHQHGVIHRDVKPANILVDESGAVVVTDFGIAKARETEALTATGSTIGTPAYMSPEQAMGKRAEPASDQYSLGAVAYELLTGRMLFIAETAMGLLYQHTHTPPEPLRQVRPDIPEVVAEAVQRMLAKSPGDRFPSLAEASRSLGIPPSAGDLDDPVRRELATLARGGPGPTLRSSTPSGKLPLRSKPTSDPNATTMPWIDTGRRRRPYLVLAAGVAVAAVAFGSWSLQVDRAGTATTPATSPSRPEMPAASPAADTGLSRPAAPTPARPTAPRPTAATRAPSVATIPVAIERYRKAVESRDITQVLAAYPAMEPEQVESYREFFRTISQLRFEVIIQDLEQEEGEARMKLEGFLRYRERASREDKIRPYRTRARLADGPTGWRILEIK